jgi:hypothetical protein
MSEKLQTRDVIFVSHANPEDNDFALWVSLRLAAEGYAVWCDLTELLGGEDFWKDIQNVLETRTAKFLFVTSDTSTTKDGVLQELTVAKRVAKTNNLSDFVIPLHIDQCQTNIEISRINYIPFNESWAAGLAQLLKKLEKDGTPKNINFNHEVVSAWWKEHFSSDAGVLDEPETLFSNWFPISPLPEKISVHVFQPGYSRSLLLSSFTGLPPTREHANAIITFAPTSDFPNSSSVFWKSSSYLVSDLMDDKHKQTLVDAKTFNNILVDLLRQAWENCLIKSGLDSFEIASGDKCGYFKKDLILNDRASFDINGFKGGRNVVGYKTTNKEKGNVRYWHFGVSGRFYLRKKRYLAVNPHVVFSDDGKTIWTSAERMHKAKMRQCSDWWNHHWRDRILGTMRFLADDGVIVLNLASDQVCEIDLQPISFTSPVLFHDPSGPNEEVDSAEYEGSIQEESDDEDEWN